MTAVVLIRNGLEKDLHYAATEVRSLTCVNRDCLCAATVPLAV